jgi:hypothetical protein
MGARVKKNSQFMASDAYFAWRTLVQQGESSVIIFTPFLDRLAKLLLENCPASISDRVVVTDLSPRSGAIDYKAQLLTLKVLVEAGVEVRSLPRLHAKVLWVDRHFISLGSQNFTTYARKSKEVTSVPQPPPGDSKFTQTLDQWLNASTPVTADLLDHLIAGLKVLWATQEKAANATFQAFDELLAQYQLEAELREELAQLEAEQSAALLRRAALSFESLTRGSPLRLAQTTAWASMSTVGGWNSGWYTSLLADREFNLIEWVRPGSAETLPLRRTKMYPLMVAETGRMGFARVGKTRISYVRPNARSESTLLGELRVFVTISFPADDLARRNIQIEFQYKFDPRMHCNVEALFDGDNLTVLPADEETASEYFAGRCYDCLRNPQTRNQFIQEHFGSFRYSSGLNIADHNAQDFFDGIRYKIGLLEFASIPFFLVSKVY